MASIEHNNEDWKEMRTRVDSIAGAIFLIAGGALSLSISVIIANLESLHISIEAFQRIQNAWLGLFGSIVLALFLKILIVFEAFMLQENTAFMDKNYQRFNIASWIIGGLSFLLFVIGFYLMIAAAVSFIAHQII